MKLLDSAAQEVARSRYGLVTRGDVLALGGTDRTIATRKRSGRWVETHPGVYLIGAISHDWRGRLMAAVLAAGDGAVASHRAAVVLWGLDGISAAPVELTVPLLCEPVPAGAVVHRTRRPVPLSVVHAIPVSNVERTILDAASCLPSVVVEKIFESAVRRGLTTPEKTHQVVSEQGGRGVRGTRTLRLILGWRRPGRAPGSGGEVEAARLLRSAGVVDFICQWEVKLADEGVAVVDIGFPHLGKGIEIDGLDAHASARALQQDLERQNALLEAGIELRRFTVRDIRSRPEWVVATVRRFVGA